MPEQKYLVNPDRNKPWNNLPLLPIDKSFHKNIAVLEQLVKSTTAISKLQGRSVVIPNQGLLVNTISLQEAKASSQIENIFTTDDELYKEFSKNNIQETSGAPKEILRYREALWSGYHYLKNAGKLDLDYPVKIFQEILGTNEGIRHAHSRIVIRQGGSVPSAGQIIYTPPRGEGVVEEKLSNLLNFLTDRNDQVDPLVKMAVSHLQFEAIHPFRDGNGRVGRIININYLTYCGLLDYPILFLSKYIIDNKDEYYERLMGVTQRGDWKSWILYMLRAVEQTANITYGKINDIISAKDAVLKLLHEHKEIKNPDQIIEILFTQPLCTVKHFTQQKLFSVNTTRKYLGKMCDLGILLRKEIGGHHYYLNIDLYHILGG